METINNGKLSAAGHIFWTTAMYAGSAGIDREMSNLSRVLAPETGLPKQHQTRLKWAHLLPWSWALALWNYWTASRLRQVEAATIASAPFLVRLRKGYLFRACFSRKLVLVGPVWDFCMRAWDLMWQSEWLIAACQAACQGTEFDQVVCREKVFGPTSFFVTSIQPLSYLRMMNVKIVNLDTPSASSPDLIQSSVLVGLTGLLPNNRYLLCWNTCVKSRDT